MNEEEVPLTKDRACADFSKVARFMVDNIMTDKKNLGRRKPFNKSGNGPELRCPEGTPLGNNNELRSVFLESFIYMPPSKWVNGVQEILYAFFLERPYARVPVRFSRKNQPGYCRLKA
jgi:hypothetical protein